jgi:hypothetical protein
MDLYRLLIGAGVGGAVGFGLAFAFVIWKRRARRGGFDLQTALGKGVRAP